MWISKSWTTWILAAAVLVSVTSAAHGVITALTPLRAFLADSQWVLVAKVEKLYPEKHGMVLAIAEDLKGKAAFRKLTISLAGDKEGQKTNDPARLLKRLAGNTPLVLFINQNEQLYTAFAYSNGTWFQVIGQKTADRIAWRFTHLEPYLRRTYKGTTKELQQIVKDTLAGKIKPPEANPKEAPGVGPEIPEKKDARSGDLGGERKAALHGLKPALRTGSGLFAVIPTLGIGGPLAILALLFPSLFGGVLVLFRQWASFLTVISLISLAYLFYLLFGAEFPESWWTTPGGMTLLMISLTFFGAVWSWRRSWRALANGQPIITPQRTENVVLVVLSLACFAVVLIYRDERMGVLEWGLLVGFSAGIWAATLYKVFRGLLRSGSGLPLPTEGVMLWTVLFTLAGMAAARSGTGSIEGTKSESAHAKSKLIGELWVFPVPRSGCAVSAPFVTDERIYFAAAHTTFRQGALFCLDRATGKKIWQFADRGTLKQVFSSPLMAYGRLYFGEGFHDDADCKVYCLDADKGQKIWDFQTTSQTESSPFVKGGKVFIGGGNDGLYCLDAATGKKVWQYPPLPHEGRLLRIGSSPVVREGRLYAGSGVDRNRKDDPGETAFLCLDAATGKLVWKVPTDLPCWGAPVVSGNEVFFGLGNGDIFDDASNPAGAMLCALAGSGKVLWRRDVANGVLEKPAVDKERVIFGCRDGHCYCLNRANGDVLWKTFLGSPVIACPALARNTLTAKTASVYALATAGKVCCLDPASGEIEWTYSVPSTPYLSAAPTVVVSRTVEGDRRHLYVAATLDNPTSGRPVLYCLEDFMPNAVGPP